MGSYTIRRTHNLYQVVENGIKTIYQDNNLARIKEFIRRSKNELKTLNQKGCGMSHQAHALKYSRTINS